MDTSDPTDPTDPTDTSGTTTAATPERRTDRSSSLVRLLGILVIVAGGIFAAAGVLTWFVVRSQLSDERITVSADAERFVGDPVDGPLTAYAEADVIEKHALEASGGKTYAELERDDPKRDTVMTASFLRSSLFTSVVSFGVALMSAGLGLVLVLIGVALVKLAGRLPAASG